MIIAENVTKKFGRNIAVDNINFHIKKGEVIGFLGPNGAGKSTTMNMVTGYISSTGGSITIDGHNILEEPEAAKARIGYLPENPPLYFDMTVKEYLSFVGKLKKVPGKIYKKDIGKIMDLVKIGKVEKRLIGNLSKGYKQRVGLAQALVGNPPLLILDEPTVGLDPAQIIEIRNLIKDLRQEHTIVISSHILPEISAVCERVLIINKGRIVASDSPRELSRRLAGTNKLFLRLKGSESCFMSALSDIKEITSVQPQSSKEEGTFDVLVEAEPESDIRESVFNTMSRIGCPIYQMRPMDLTLEDIFLNLTTSEETNK